MTATPRQLSALRKRYAIVIRDTDAQGFRYMGKNNPTMHELRKLGFYRFDKASGEGFGENYRPRWVITDAGRAALQSEKTP